jgi:hypothetical protein
MVDASIGTPSESIVGSVWVLLLLPFGLVEAVRPLDGSLSAMSSSSSIACRSNTVRVSPSESGDG